MALRWLAGVVAWPSLLALNVWLTFTMDDAFGFSHSAAKQASYVVTLVVVLLCETLLPHNPTWNLLGSGAGGVALDRKVDNWPFVADWLHGVVGPVLAFEASRPLMRSSLWPSNQATSVAIAGLPWPLQLLLALLVNDLGAYWQHRCSHTQAMLWPFHALHHIPARLYSINTVRFHLGDVALRALATHGVLYSLGFDERVIDVVVVLKASIGLLSHCNIDTRCHALNYVFNTPENHRWHHSTSVDESNCNYSEIFTFWDIVFGTFYCPPRPTPGNVGRARFKDGPGGIKRLPKTFWGQCWMPILHSARAASKKE